ncbi:MAG TPA: hypothetical protein VHE61_21610 [Opitutaceae bacterium]|nr:hypothetical protein [Opitutaceae bacterium]
MKRFPQAIVGLAVVLSGPTLLCAAPPSEASPGGNPILAPASAAPAAPRPAARAMSATTAAHFAAVAPKYQPASKAKPAAEPPDETQEDRPRNGIIRLPRYVVAAPKLPPLSQYQMLTPKGKLDLAMKMFPGLHLGPFSLGNNQVALDMLADDAAAERRRQMGDLLGLLPGNDTLLDKEKRTLIQQAMMPHPISAAENLSSHDPGH